MKILRNPEDLEAFIREESLAWGLSESKDRELRREIKPREYPCAVFVHWSEGAGSMFLVSDIVYVRDLVGTVTEMNLCETEHLFLHPDQLYRFVVGVGCKRCKEMAKMSTH